MQEYQILLFYKYVFIENPSLVRDWQESLCKTYGLKGRLIIAKEGINITLEGTRENTEKYILELEADERFKNIHFKRSIGTGNAFPRLSVKVRDEIVSGHLGICDVNPNEVTGKRLSPETLHSWIHEQKEFYIVDMRNVYEHDIGRFKDSICPPMRNFRDLPQVTKDLAHLKDKTVVTVCTGGVRCEKASGYLITQGFNDVYQLEGGIVSYMEKYPNEDFEGKLYVFDGRVTMGFYTDDPKHVIVGKCKTCGEPSENIVDCRNGGCNGQFIICTECEKAQLETYGITKCPSGCTIQIRNKRSPIKRFFNTIQTLFR